MSMRIIPSKEKMRLWALLGIVMLVGLYCIPPSMIHVLPESDESTTTNDAHVLSGHLYEDFCDLHIIGGSFELVAPLGFVIEVPRSDSNMTNITSWFFDYRLNTSSAPALDGSHVLIDRVRSYPFLYTDGTKIYDRYLDGPSASDIDLTYDQWFTNLGEGFPNHLTVDIGNLSHYVSMGMYLLLEGISVKNGTTIYTCNPSTLLFNVNWSWSPTANIDVITFTNREITVWDSFNQTHEIEVQAILGFLHPGIYVQTNFPETVSPNYLGGAIIIGIGVMAILCIIWLKRRRRS
ncbi:MAG: hypothetical protein ACTSYL_11250 [Candidatus Thorarchaeota archaeon]